MKICYGLMAYSKQDQCETLIDLLNVNDNEIVVLIDKKSDALFNYLFDKYNKDPHIHFIKDRISVDRGGITTSEATVSLFKNSLKYDYDYYTMVSESCLPLYSDKEIKGYLERHKGEEFIDVRFDWTKRSRLYLDHSKPYTAWQRKHRNVMACRDVFVDTLFGWAVGKNKQFKSHKVPTTLLWFTLSKELVTYMVKTIEEEKLLEKYKNTLIADEHIFAEVVLNSKFYDRLRYKGIRGNALLYCDWYTLNAPRVLRMKDYKRLYSYKYPCLYARKFDKKTNPEVYNKVIKNRLNDDFKCKYE